MQTISVLDAERASAVRPLLVVVAESVLGSEVEGTSSSSASVTWTRGAVVVSEELERLRDEAITLIEQAFLEASNNSDRRRAFEAYKAATELPHVNELPDDLVVRVRRDTARLIRFLQDHTDILSNPLLQSVEQSVHLYYRWNRNPRECAASTAILDAERGVVEAALQFRDHLATNDDYSIFKVLVGYQAIFDDAWDASDFSEAYELNNQRRDECAAELLAGVNLQNASEWFDRLNRYAGMEPNHLGKNPNLGQFIAGIIRTEPSLGPLWLDRSQGQPIGYFTSGILRGLYDAEPNTAIAWCEQAIDDGKSIVSVAQFLSCAEPPLVDLIVRMADVAVQLRDNEAARYVLEFAVKHVDELGAARAIEIGLGMIEFLAGTAEDQWSSIVWICSRNSSFLSLLGNEGRKRLLKSMVHLKQIDYHDEEILSSIAPDFPDEIIEMFGQRLKIERSQDADAFDPKRFEAIPFNFQKLHTVFPKASIGPVLEDVSGWSESSDWLVEYRGGKLIANLFPDLPDELIDGLTSFSSSGHEATREFVLAVAKNYESAPGVWKVMKEFVAHSNPDDARLDDVMIALQSTGVTHGEFGRRDALMAQRRAIEAWFKDERKQVQAFAKSFAQSLDNQIAAEQQRTERDIAQRRLEYGEPITPQEDGDDNVEASNR